MPEPEPIEVARGLRLRGYDGEADVDAAWPWYQDLDTVRLVDGDGAQPYSRDTVRSMYEALSGKGDVFMIEQLSKADTTVPVRILRCKGWTPHGGPAVSEPPSRPDFWWLAHRSVRLPFG